MMYREEGEGRPLQGWSSGTSENQGCVGAASLTLRCTVSSLQDARWWRAFGTRFKKVMIQTYVWPSLQDWPRTGTIQAFWLTTNCNHPSIGLTADDAHPNKPQGWDGFAPGRAVGATGRRYGPQLI